MKEKGRKYYKVVKGAGEDQWLVAERRDLPGTLEGAIEDPLDKVEEMSATAGMEKLSNPERPSDGEEE